MQVSMVPPDHITNVWPNIEDYMARAIKYAKGRYELVDVLDGLLNGVYTLWIAFDDESIRGVVVTSFVVYPRRKLLHLTFCGGNEGMTWKDPMLKMLQHWAYDNGCDGIEANGRLGWSGIFRGDGYKPLWQIFELPAGESGLGV